MKFVKYEKPEIDTVTVATSSIQGGKGGTPLDSNLPPENYTASNAYVVDE